MQGLNLRPLPPEGWDALQHFATADGGPGIAAFQMEMPPDTHDVSPGLPQGFQRLPSLGHVHLSNPGHWGPVIDVGAWQGHGKTRKLDLSGTLRHDKVDVRVGRGVAVHFKGFPEALEESNVTVVDSHGWPTGARESLHGLIHDRSSDDLPAEALRTGWSQQALAAQVQLNKKAMLRSGIHANQPASCRHLALLEARQLHAHRMANAQRLEDYMPLLRLTYDHLKSKEAIGALSEQSDLEADYMDFQEHGACTMFPARSLAALAEEAFQEELGMPRPGDIGIFLMGTCNHETVLELRVTQFLDDLPPSCVIRFFDPRFTILPKILKVRDPSDLQGFEFSHLVDESWYECITDAARSPILTLNRWPATHAVERTDVHLCSPEEIASVEFMIQAWMGRSPDAMRMCVSAMLARPRPPGEDMRLLKLLLSLKHKPVPGGTGKRTHATLRALFDPVLADPSLGIDAQCAVLRVESNGRAFARKAIDAGLPHLAAAGLLSILQAPVDDATRDALLASFGATGHQVVLALGRQNDAWADELIIQIGEYLYLPGKESRIG